MASLARRFWLACTLVAWGFEALAPATAAAQGAALRLGPSNTDTYVTFGVASALAQPQFTLETWFNRQGTGVATTTGTGGLRVCAGGANAGQSCLTDGQCPSSTCSAGSFVPLLTKGAAQAEASNVDANYLLGINTAGNVLAVDFEQFGTCTGGTGNCTTAPFGPGCSCSVNADCQSAVCANAGLNHPLSGVTPIASNTWYHAAATYDGTAWRLYLNGELEAELLVGAPARSDSIQHAALGTTLTSTGTPAGFFDGFLDEARVWNVARSAADIRATMNVQNLSDATLVARWGLDEGAGTTVGDSAGTPQNGTITGANFAWVASGPFDVAPCANAASSLLRFDGTNDYVTFGNAAELGLTTFTIETWFRREAPGTAASTGAGGITALVPLIAKGAQQADGASCPTGDGRCDANYVLGINTSASPNVLAADFEDTATGLNHPVSGSTPILSNVWYHAAATYDGSTWRLYLNGNLEATLAVGAFTPRFDSLQHAALGSMLNTTGATNGFFAGLLDEPRIWNVARSQAAIQADMPNQLTSGPGLVARWGLGEGTGTTIADSVAPSTVGTLTNGPTWTASSSLFDASGACEDGTFCNGGDTCSGRGIDGLRCTLHAGDPCAAGGECADSCNEAADDCFEPLGTACTADAEICTLDQCDGAGACAHPAGNAGTLCRAGSGDACDPDEVCNGIGATCPADVVAPGGTVCNAGSGDACDPDETCSGLAGQPCPSDTVAPGGTLCRPGSGDVCDPAESCTGVPDQPCPSDTITASGTVCRTGSGDSCDPSESCTGVANQPCPADTVTPSGTVCRTGSGDVCDPAESCTGIAGQACPADSVASASLTCRVSAGACDPAEHCPGIAGQPCPPDVLSPNTTPCRAAVDTCDVAENCDGVNPDCPADGLAPSTQVCRPSAGTCDVAEHCTGTGPTCPPDTGLPDTDGDAVCDAIDNCPSDPNPGQDDGDADDLGDVCDPCTAGASASKHKLTLTKLLAPAGDDRLSFKAQAVLTTPLAPPLDPLANGVRLLIQDAVGATVLDATVAGGAYDPLSKTGWKVNGSGTTWTYKNPGTHPQGITTVGVKTSASSPGMVKVKAKGKNGSYAVAAGDLPVRVTLVLDPPTATTGECVEAAWTAVPPARPSCTAVTTGNVVKCK